MCASIIRFAGRDGHAIPIQNLLRRTTPLTTYFEAGGNLAAGNSIVARQIRFEGTIETMIWLSIASLAAGVLLAYRFKIMVLIPATLVTVVVAAASAGNARIKGVWSILLIVGVASVCTQTGFLIGMLTQHRLGMLLARKSSPFSDARSAQDPAR
jgi:hypothetical protein